MSKKRRESRYVRYARVAYQVTQATFPAYRHRNSPRTYTQPQLISCVLLGFYLDISYRDLEEWLLATEQVCAVLGLARIPSYSTLCRTFQQLRLVELEALHTQLLAQLVLETEVLAVDASGFRPTRASQHYLSRSGRLMREYAQGFYSVSCEQQYIVAWRYARGPDGSDAQYWDCLRRRSQRVLRRVNRAHVWVFTADKGFDGPAARPFDLIPPRQGNHRVKRPDRRQRLEFVRQARLDGTLGQRWKVETVFSVMKRLSGDALRSRSVSGHRREIAWKALVYNLHRLPFPVPAEPCNKAA